MNPKSKREAIEALAVSLCSASQTGNQFVFNATMLAVQKELLVLIPDKKVKELKKS